MFNKKSELFSKISQDFAFYTPDLSNKKTSGAYLFVPLQKQAEPVTNGPVEIKVIKVLILVLLLSFGKVLFFTMSVCVLFVKDHLHSFIFTFKFGVTISRE